MIRLTINGKPKELSAPTGLVNYLESLDISTQFIAVGYNGEVIEKESFQEITLSEGDVVEIVRPVGGG